MPASALPPPPAPVLGRTAEPPLEEGAAVRAVPEREAGAPVPTREAAAVPPRDARPEREVGSSCPAVRGFLGLTVFIVLMLSTYTSVPRGPSAPTFSETLRL